MILQGTELQKHVDVISAPDCLALEEEYLPLGTSQKLKRGPELESERREQLSSMAKVYGGVVAAQLLPLCCSGALEINKQGSFEDKGIQLSIEESSSKRARWYLHPRKESMVI